MQETNGRKSSNLVKSHKMIKTISLDCTQSIYQLNLRQEWNDRQAKLKNEEIQITFSFWDGSGHRRMLTMKKGKTIYQFLQKALEDLRSDFLELRSARFQITKTRQKLLFFCEIDWSYLCLQQFDRFQIFNMQLPQTEIMQIC